MLALVHANSEKSHPHTDDACNLLFTKKDRITVLVLSFEKHYDVEKSTPGTDFSSPIPTSGKEF